MRSTICFLFFFVYLLPFHKPAHGQHPAYVQKTALSQNDPVSISDFSWASQPDATGIDGQLTVSNHTADKTIQSVTVFIIAYDNKGITLQENGTTIKKLSRSAPIDAGATSTLTFENAYRSARISKVVLHQVIVEFTNGSLLIIP